MLIVPDALIAASIPIPYPVAIIGTAVALFLWGALAAIGQHTIAHRDPDPKERYRKSQVFRTVLAIVAISVIIILWARLLQHTGTFLGVIGAGLAIALREPLLSIAGRIAIFAAKIYSAGDRIEIEGLRGDVIDIGFFYTRMMEIGNWIKGDQVSGRIVQFANARIFGNPVFNYTRDFSYIWDELQIPITYDSNVQQMTEILLAIGGDYTREFLRGAERELEQMKHYFLVPSFELEPSVYLKVTDNWLELHMRYVVDPKKRRSASNFIYGEVFKRMQGRKDIAIASSTMDLTVHGRAPRSTNGSPTLSDDETAA